MKVYKNTECFYIENVKKLFPILFLKKWMKNIPIGGSLFLGRSIVLIYSFAFCNTMFSKFYQIKTFVKNKNIPIITMPMEKMKILLFNDVFFSVLSKTFL